MFLGNTGEASRVLQVSEGQLRRKGRRGLLEPIVFTNCREPKRGGSKTSKGERIQAELWLLFSAVNSVR